MENQLELAFPAWERASAGVGPESWSEDALLRHLRSLGANRLERVRFRENRSTIWSLTRSGSRLNLHSGFQSAPRIVVEEFAVIAAEWRDPSPAYRRAARVVREWPGLVNAMERVRATGPPRRRLERAGHRRVGRVACAGSPSQQAFLRSAYRHYNLVRFGDALPYDVRLRFSARMTRRLGQMTAVGVPTTGAAGDASMGRTAFEIALSLDLLLVGNEADFVDTLLHEMAHVADFLERGRTDHGPRWRRWAERVGCEPRACGSELAARRGVAGPVDGIPPGLRALRGPGGAFLDGGLGSGPPYVGWDR